METEILKNRIHELVDKVSDYETLEAIHGLLKHSSEKESKFYNASGEEISQSTLEKMIEESEEDIKNGDIVEHESLKKEIKTWRK